MPRPESIATARHLVAVAGSRWRVEESFQTAKIGLGLDQHQHRRWRAWHCWTTLVIVAHAFRRRDGNQHERVDRYHRQELRQLFHALVIEPVRRIVWFLFRRRHQAMAMTSRYARQALKEP